ncbi:unnamed protein product [Zymoseptoria tritici ST99CH_3D1]|nr:unnamed protein product [Zymoseptoria tritici ST99CH_3D1]
MNGKPGTESPGSSASSSAVSPSTSRARARSSKREQVVAACYECRSKKVKCDAARPACGRCSSRSLSCYYDVEPETSRAVALKRKHESVQDDLDRMTELYDYIRSRSEGEVWDLVSQIRQTADPFKFLKLVRDRNGDLPTGLPEPNVKAMMRQLDASALEESRIKVRASPWTSIAGDGIVSHLISRALEPSVTTFIDEEALTTDMSVQNPGTTPYCSALLVNVLCAFGTFGSTYVDRIDSSTKLNDEGKLRVQFFNKARDLLDEERGKASLPTVQALFLLYLYWNFLGMDRAGLVYRLQGVDMFKKLRLGSQTLPCERGYNEALNRRACSRNAWGLFCAESYISYAYHQPSLIPIPTLPHYFTEPTPFERIDTVMIRTSDDVLEARCHLLSIFYRIASYKPREPNVLGSHADIATRQRLYDALRGWHSVLPDRPHYSPHQAIHYRVFRSQFHLLSAILWRPLQDIAVRLESGYTPAAVCIWHCTKVLDEVEANMREYPRDTERGARGSLSVLWLCHMLSFTLILMLRRHRDSLEPLVRVVRLLHALGTTWPNARVLLRAMYAISLQLRVELPEEALQYCRGTDMEESLYSDMPTSYTVARHADFEDVDGQGDDSGDGIEVGGLISKWAALAIKPRDE